MKFSSIFRAVHHNPGFYDTKDYGYLLSDTSVLNILENGWKIVKNTSIGEKGVKRFKSGALFGRMPKPVNYIRSIQ